MTCDANTPSPPGRPKTLGAILVLVLLGMIAQAVPFSVDHTPTVDRLPEDYPQNYSYEDLSTAHRYSRPVVLGGLARRITTILALVVVILSGFANRSEAHTSSRALQWSARLLFLIAVYVWLYLVRIPYTGMVHMHDISFGITEISTTQRLRLLLLSLPIPLSLFILKYLLIFCTVPLFKRWWWIGAAALLFLLAHVIPEFVSRTRPAHPIKTLVPLESGPHTEALQQVSQKAGIDLPLFVEDRSERSNTVNIYIAGRAGREYVTLTDTFVDSFSPKEAGAALAHELGHQQRGRESLLISKALALLKLLTGLGLAAWFSRKIQWQQSTPMRIVLIAMLSLSLTRIAFLPITNAVSREEERNSDRYAVEITGDPETLRGLLVKVAKRNMEPLDLPRWEYYMFSGHPTVLERFNITRQAAADQ